MWGIGFFVIIVVIYIFQEPLDKFINKKEKL